jgi:hypothetical protein
MALSTAGDAIRAIDLQAFRLRHPDTAGGVFDDAGFQAYTEARFMIVAVRWLQSACTLVADLTDDEELRESISQLWTATGVADAKDMRDVWEHFADYIVGDGRLQRPGQRAKPVGGSGSLGVYVWTGGSGALGSLHWAGLSLSLDEAARCAHRLYRTTVQAVARSLGAGPAAQVPSA